MSDNQFQGYLDSLAARLERLELAPATSSRASNAGLPKVSFPDKFDGTLSKFRDFLASVENIFVLHAPRYSTDEIKIRFIGTLLEKDPLSWFRSLIERKSMSLTAELDDESSSETDILANYSLFITTFKALYDDPHAKRHAQAAIKRLKQGKGSVVSYSAKFRRIAQDTCFDSQALLDIFRYGLNDDVKDVLASSLFEPEKLEDFIHFCIKIDNRLFDRKIERSNGPRYQKQFSGSFRTPAPPVLAAQPSSSGPTPMELDTIQIKTKKLTPEEKQRRLLNNLCLYCGEAGHKAINCPKKSKN